MPFELDEVLREVLSRGASDLHLKVGGRPRMRLDGELLTLDGHAPITPQEAVGVRDKVVSTPLKRRELDERGSTDLSYWTRQGRFRVCAFTQRGTASFVFRTIPQAPEADRLGLPEVVVTWADELRGLVVISGPTGSGKSTTSAALVDRVNARRACHVVTIEDPIEFLHNDRRALISQREVGVDAPSHQDALRAAMRQDPDVMVVGEVRDEDTAMTALRAAETGHLVLCTMHTSSTTETVQRFVDLFGSDRATLARQMLAASLVGVVSQRLVPAVDSGRALNTEVLVNTARIRDLLETSAPAAELRRAIAEGDFYGMRTFDQCLLRHVSAGRITHDDAVSFATSGHDFELMLAAQRPQRRATGNGSAAGVAAGRLGR